MEVSRNCETCETLCETSYGETLRFNLNRTLVADMAWGLPKQRNKTVSLKRALPCLRAPTSMPDGHNCLFDINDERSAWPYRRSGTRVKLKPMLMSLGRIGKNAYASSAPKLLRIASRTYNSASSSTIPKVGCVHSEPKIVPLDAPACMLPMSKMDMACNASSAGQ